MFLAWKYIERQLSQKFLSSLPSVAEESSRLHSIGTNFSPRSSIVRPEYLATILTVVYLWNSLMISSVSMTLVMKNGLRWNGPGDGILEALLVVPLGSERCICSRDTKKKHFCTN
jgi:hypothetical protein